MKKLYFAYLKCLSFNKNFSLQRLYSDCELHRDDSSPVRTFVFDSINGYTFPPQCFIDNIDNNFSHQRLYSDRQLHRDDSSPVRPARSSQLQALLSNQGTDHPFLHNQPSPKNIA